jgi:hypothetical protein
VVGPAVRAEGIPPPDNTDFFRESFGPYEPAQHTVDTWIRPQRLLTSCAHRLRKPHRTNRPLTPSVAARLQSPALLAQLCPPSRPPLAMFIATREPALPGTEIALVGLGPWPSQNQGAFHWIDPRSCDRIRLARAPFDVRSRPPRTLSPTANQPRMSTESCRVKLTRRAVASFWLAFAAPGRRVYPTSATDLHYEHSADRSVLESPPSLAFAVERGFHAVCPVLTLAGRVIESSLV